MDGGDSGRRRRTAGEDGRGRRRTAEEDGGTAWAVNGAEDGGGGRMAAWTAWAQPGNQSSYGVLLIIHTRVRVREGVCEKITDRDFRLGENKCAQKREVRFLPDASLLIINVSQRQ